MKKSIFILVLLNTLYSFAQNDSTGVEKLQLRADFLLTPALNLEWGISKYSTLEIDLGTGINEARDAATNKPFTGLFPTAEVGYRYYYNLKRRNQKNKNTANNSGNYFGINALYIFGSNPIIIENSVNVDDNIYKINAAYGWQRTYNNKWTIGLEGAIGYRDSEVKGGEFDVAVNFNLGFILFHK